MRTLALSLAFSSFLILPAVEVSDRESITFILGDETDGMYALATSFHTNLGDRVITSANSLQAVRNYLEEHPPVNHQPWGRVEMVLHGNGRGQTDVPLLGGGTITTTAYLDEVLAQGDFRPLSDRLLDDQSELRLHGCGLGQDEHFLKLISQAFGGADEKRPTVRASRLYTCYRPTEEGAHRYFSEAWSIVFPPNHEPSGIEINARLRASAPSYDLDAVDTLSRRSSRFPGDSFVEIKPLHFQWKIVFERAEERPHAKSAIPWLRKQRDLAERLKAQDLSFDDLTWEAKASREIFQGRSHPTLLVEGHGKAFHLMRSLKDESLAWEDPQYCVSEK